FCIWLADYVAVHAYGTKRMSRYVHYLSAFGAKRTLTEPRAYRERIYEYASSRSRRDRVACRWHAGGATQRERPRAPCAMRPLLLAARPGWPSIRRASARKR